MLQNGVVIAVEGDIATVRIARCAACEHCGACFRMGESEADIRLHNPIQAQIGDTVAIRMQPRSVVKASAIAYGIPLCALLAGVLLGSRWGDLYAAVGGLLLAGGTFFILRALEPRFAGRREFMPEITGFALPEKEPDKEPRT